MASVEINIEGTDYFVPSGVAEYLNTITDLLMAEREKNDAQTDELLAALRGDNVPGFHSVYFDPEEATLLLSDALFHFEHDEALSLLMTDQPEPQEVTTDTN